MLIFEGPEFIASRHKMAFIGINDARCTDVLEDLALDLRMGDLYLL